jgi:hypothetical protein
VRYAAPEIYAVSPTPNPQTVRVSVQSDIYSFGSIMLQVGILSNDTSHGMGKTVFTYGKFNRPCLAGYHIITYEMMLWCYWKYTPADLINAHPKRGLQTVTGNLLTNAGMRPLITGRPWKKLFLTCEYTTPLLLLYEPMANTFCSERHLIVSTIHLMVEANPEHSFIVQTK